MKRTATLRAAKSNGLRHAEHVTIPVESSALSRDCFLEHLPTGETCVLKGVLHAMSNGELSDADAAKRSRHSSPALGCPFGGYPLIYQSDSRVESYNEK